MTGGEVNFHGLLLDQAVTSNSASKLLIAVIGDYCDQFMIYGGRSYCCAFKKKEKRVLKKADINKTWHL